MEIHPPERAIHSIQDFLLHLSMITIGIPIALSLEGIMEWRHHRALVREAQENLRSEIRDNKKDLDGELKAVPERDKERQHALEVLADLLARKKLTSIQVNLAANQAELSAASWSTAEQTGALGLMEYAEVKRYAEVYALQQRFKQAQDKFMESTIAALQVLRSGNPTKLSERELEADKQQILTTLSWLLAGKQTGQQLSGFEEHRRRPALF